MVKDIKNLEVSLPPLDEQSCIAALAMDELTAYLIVDSTIIRAHQHASGAKKGGLKIRPLAAPAAA